MKGILAGLWDRLVGTEDEVQGPVEYERVFLDNVRKRCVGRQAQRRIRANIANVIAAMRRLARLCAVVTRWSQADANPRRTGFRPDTPCQHHGSEHAPDVFVAGREIRDADRAAIRVVQDRVQDGGIRLVNLFAVREIDELHFEEAGQVELIVVAQQAAEDRVGVELRHAGPDHRRTSIDERCHLAISDQTDVETGQETLSLVPVIDECFVRLIRASDAPLQRPVRSIEPRCRGCRQRESLSRPGH